MERHAELGTTTLSEKAYIAGLMERFNVMTTSNTPANPGGDPGPKRDGEPGVGKPMGEALGCFMLPATFTRPDIAVALNMVQRHAHAPIGRHWKAIVQSLSYLNATRDFDITRGGSGLDLAAYVIASYADKETNRHSWTGLAVPLGGAVVSHDSKTRRVVALSTSEAEYIAAEEGVRGAVCACSAFVRSTREEWVEHQGH